MSQLTRQNAAVLLAIVALTGCARYQTSSDALQRRDVIGKYVANHGKGLDLIDVRQDGTYAYTYRPSTGGEELRNTGSWSLHYDDGKARITFHDFVFGWREYGGPMPGYWDVEVERSLGKLRLCLDPDLNYYYVRQGGR